MNTPLPLGAPGTQTSSTVRTAFSRSAAPWFGLRRMLVALVAASAFLAPTASAALLDFSGNICATAGGVCGNGSAIDQSYGDIAGVLDVTWDGDRSAAGLQPVMHWGTGYESLSHVAYGANGGGGLSILFQALPGFEVSVSAFDIAPYANRVRDSLVRVEADGLELLDTGVFSVPVGSVTSFSFAETWASSFLIELGPDAWDIGISNIAFETRATQTPIDPDPTNPVPLPGTGTLLIGAMLAWFGVRRGPAVKRSA